MPVKQIETFFERQESDFKISKLPLPHLGWYLLFEWPSATFVYEQVRIRLNEAWTDQANMHHS